MHHTRHHKLRQLTHEFRTNSTIALLITAVTPPPKRRFGRRLKLAELKHTGHCSDHIRVHPLCPAMASALELVAELHDVERCVAARSAVPRERAVVARRVQA